MPIRSAGPPINGSGNHWSYSIDPLKEMTDRASRTVDILARLMGATRLKAIKTSYHEYSETRQKNTPENSPGYTTSY